MLQKTFGGSIRWEQRKRSHWRDRYEWRSTSWDAIRFLEAVLPFLLIKRQQAVLALDFQRSIRHEGNRWAHMSDSEWQRRNSIYEAMKKLNGGATKTRKRPDATQCT
jgi:hypothetical protein